MRYCPTCGTRFSHDVSFCPHDGAATQELVDDGPQEDPLLGQVVDGRYRIESQVGEGGMGVVYLASHTVLGKKLALKVLRGEMARDGEVVQRFMQEAQAATSIGHENIIDISDFGRLPDGAVYFVMEYLDGQALTDMVERGGSIPTADAIRIIRQIASALSAAHKRGIVHRDLKPDNVILVERSRSQHFVKVLDFGIAKVGGASSKLTKTGMVFGTPHYMSPEQAAGQSVDQRTDIYALGVIMYEMFTGRVPFDADTFMGILSKHMFEPPIPPSEVLGEARLGALEDVVLKALAKKPEERYQNMEEVIADLDAVSSGGVVQIGQPHGIAPPNNLADNLEPPSRTEMRLAGLAQSKGPKLAVVVGVGLLALGGAAVGGWLLLGGDGGEEAAAMAAAPADVDEGAVAEPEDAGAPETATAVTEAAETEAAEAEPRSVEIRSTPEGAQVLVAGAIIGNTPVEVPLPAEGEEREVVVRQRGYERTTVRLTAESPGDGIDVALEERQEERRAHRTRRRRPTRTTTEASPAMETTMSTRRRGSLGSEVVDPWAD